MKIEEAFQVLGLPEGTIMRTSRLARKLFDHDDLQIGSKVSPNRVSGWLKYANAGGYCAFVIIQISSQPDFLKRSRFGFSTFDYSHRIYS